ALYGFVIYTDVMSLMAELVQIARVKVSPPAQALDPSLHLLPMGLFFQTRVLCIEPLQEFRIIRAKNKKTHTRLLDRFYRRGSSNRTEEAIWFPLHQQPLCMV